MQTKYVIVPTHSVMGKVAVPTYSGSNNCLVNENVFRYAFIKKHQEVKTNENCCNLRKVFQQQPNRAIY